MTGTAFLDDLAALVALDTVSPIDTGRLAACGAELARHGCRPVRPGLFGYGDPGARTWLYSHVDTKPPTPLEEWASDPFTLRVEPDRWLGLGVSDAKFQLLNALTAADPARHFVLIDTCEEYDGDGAAADFLAEHRPQTLVICDGAKDGCDIYAGHMGQVDGEFLLDTGQQPRHPARRAGDVAGRLAALLADLARPGPICTITGLAAPATERSLSLQQATVKFDLRYGAGDEAIVRALLDRHPHHLRQWMHPVTGLQPETEGTGGPAASASRLGVRGPLDVRRVLVVPGADPDNRNHQPEEFIRPGQVDRHLRTLRRVLASLEEEARPATVRPGHRPARCEESEST
ncbi:M20/M25/M40 family metallo-hydrolase [Streptomyces sp. MB09-01]|uniref:M20/M25/M40 family metallo-hydrolase n=1 Tax=Streptomyces sp. MB09-01 TaxID=3028666 RepID=UPI0029B4145B|nr:M20/M25/M40 family metallo-hydrolase [Streptomyces sp. MB09-01]MDX3537873.1 M20/M25/M40 family metallo-hydrolase [Streptomyces sp. MB09-01]